MAAPCQSDLDRIDHFVVLMLENRSFDHLFGFRMAADPRIHGVTGEEGNAVHPGVPGSPHFLVRPATTYATPFDPGHEFANVQTQLFGPGAHPGGMPTMGGFVHDALVPAETPEIAAMVMECFQPHQIPVLSTLADEFALFNAWFSSLPGPTFPNRFFVHAATSGGMTRSPGWIESIPGFRFPAGTIFSRLEGKGLGWRLYHDGMPLCATLRSLREPYLNPFTRRGRAMKHFERDVAEGNLPAYAFLEPMYDLSHGCRNANSMHAPSDIRDGERLIKRVYEGIRNSPLWASTLLVITFDEHGGYYDHVVPPPAPPTGDDHRYDTTGFLFDRLGVRVPALAISPFTRKGTVVDEVLDHTCVLATLEARYGLAPLTQRDRWSRTLGMVLNQEAPRLSEADALTVLPEPLAVIPAQSSFPCARAAWAPPRRSFHPGRPQP